MSAGLRLRRALRRLAHRSGWSVRQLRLRPGLRILMYHGVGAPDCPLPGFTAGLEWLRSHTTVVPLDWALVRLERRRFTREVVLTFDDGLGNNASVAYPELVRLGLPAVFYVCPGLIESGAWLWNHEARARLRSLPAEARAAIAARASAPPLAAQSAVALVEWMKTLEPGRRAGLEDEVRRATPGWTPSAEERRAHDMMTWEDLARLDPELVTIGSHSLSHPILTTLTAPELEREVGESRAWLERRLGRRVEHFCYPNGAGDAAVEARVRRTYASAVTTVPAVERGSDPHRLARIPSTPEVEYLSWRLHRPAS